MSACGWQADERIIAHRGDCLKCHVAGPLDGPFVVLLQEQGTDQSDDGLVVAEDASYFSASIDLAIETLDRMCRIKLCPVFLTALSIRLASLGTLGLNLVNGITGWRPPVCLGQTPWRLPSRRSSWKAIDTRLCKRPSGLLAL